MIFQEEITNWYHKYKRTLPWRNTTDAYVIWLSEIILQQTRVEQGLPYFNKFLENFPTVQDFANAPENLILKLWQGLGYYSRGRNMHATAMQVQELHNGIFPTRYADLIRLKGIGEYTAAAISSFSAGEQQAVLDGNVFRVLSRFYGIDTPINSTAGKKEFTALARELVIGQDPAIYNQAIMEFGALQCKPKSPDCEICPLQQACIAYANNLVSLLPVKLKTVKKRNRFFNYFVCIRDGAILVNRRGAGDIWQHLHDLPMIETPAATKMSDVEFLYQVQEMFGKEVVIRPHGSVKHLLTHQTIYAQFFVLENFMINFNPKATIKSVMLDDFDDLPQPIMISNFIINYITKL